VPDVSIENSVRMNTCPRRVHEVQGQPPHSPGLSLLDFNLWGHLKTLTLSAPIENKETLDQHNFVACQTICKRLLTFGRVRQPLCALLQDTLSIFYSCTNQRMHTYEVVQLYIFRLLFFTSTYFSHSCDQLQSVL
jgi:hypothetical protein